MVRVDALGSLGLKDAPRHYSGVRLCRKRPNDEYPDGQPKCRWFLGGDSIKRVRADEAGESPALVDFDTPHSSSPTCSYTAFKFLLAHAAYHEFPTLQNDVDDAYLNERAESLVVMRFPFGFSEYLFHRYGPRRAWPYDPRTHVCVVYGNIWGHPDAGRIWDAAFTRLLTDVLMFTPTPLDPRLFFRYEPGSPPTMLALIVDDYFVTGAGNIAADVDAQINEKFKGGDVRSRPRDTRRDPHQTDARRPAVLPIAPARRDPLRQHGRARAHQAAPRQLAPPPLPRQHRLRVPRHRARPDDRPLLQDHAHARGLPHEGLTRRRVPRERRPRLPGLRVRRALSRPDGTIPPPSPWPSLAARRPRRVSRRPREPGPPLHHNQPGDFSQTNARELHVSSGGERCYGLASTSIPLANNPYHRTRQLAHTNTLGAIRHRRARGALITSLLSITGR